MTPQIRALDDVLASMENFYDTNAPTANRQTGSIIQDIIDTSGSEFGNHLYVIMTFVNEKQSVSGLTWMISSDTDAATFRANLATALGMTADETTAFISSAIDEKGSDYNLIRKAATSSTLTLRFATSSSVNANLLSGTTARTSVGIEYGTTTDVTNQPVIADSNGMYHLDAIASATIEGTASQVPVNRVNLLVPPISGFSSVTNITPSSGGTDAETDSDFLARIIQSEKGRNLDTKYGYKNFFAGQTGVSDVYVAVNSDPLMKRGEGAETDIYIMGANDTSASDTLTYDAATMGGAIILNHQPVDSVVSVTQNGVSLVVGTNYTVALDFGGFAGSNKAVDKIILITPAVDGDVFVISYIYNELIGNLQTMLTTDENNVVASDILLKEAIDIPVDIEMDVVKSAGYSSSTVNDLLTTAIENYFSGQMLAGGAYEDDIVSIGKATVGVDHIKIPLVKLALGGQVGSADIVAGGNEYVTLGSLKINFV